MRLKIGKHWEWCKSNLCSFCLRGENRTCVFVRFCLGGVGWANNVHIHLHLRTYVTLRYCSFFCTCTLAQKGTIQIEWLDLEICSHMAMVLGSNVVGSTKTESTLPRSERHRQNALALWFRARGLTKRVIFWDAFYSEYAVIPTSNCKTPCKTRILTHRTKKHCKNIARHMISMIPNQTSIFFARSISDAGSSSGWNWCWPAPRRVLSWPRLAASGLKWFMLSMIRIYKN